MTSENLGVLHLNSCVNLITPPFNKILKVKGCNDYIQPHFGKKVQEDNGRIRIQVRIPIQLVREVVTFLNPNRDQQQTQTENENAAQNSQIIHEAYDEALKKLKDDKNHSPSV